MSVAEKIYNDYVDSVFRYFYVRLENRDLSLDLVAQTFEKVINAIESYDPKKGKVSTWVFTIARNVFVDYLRKANRIKTIDLESVENSLVINKGNKSIEEYVDISIKKEILMTAIARLSPEEQELLHLRYTEDLSYKEISNKIGMNINTVGIKLHRITNKLKQLIKQKSR